MIPTVGSGSDGPIPTSEDLVRPSQVRRLLRAHGLQPNRRLGQHFLIDGNIRDHILAAAQLTADDYVLEIGPGLGTLTLPMADTAGHVVAVELDRGLFEVLSSAVSNRANVTLVHGDAMELDPRHHFAGAARAKVVSNLPYQITGPVLIKLLESGARGEPRWERLVVMVQEEVARRMTAGAGGRDYGRFSVMVQFFAGVELVRTIPATAFLPPPGVTSAVVRLTPRASLPADPGRFGQVVKGAFSQRRKTLANALSGAPDLRLDKETCRQLLQQADIDPRRRAETLTVQEFTALAGRLTAYQTLSDGQC